MKRVSLPVLLLPILFLSTAFAQDKYASSYSSIAEEKCKTIKIGEEGISVTQRCPDYQGIGVYAMEGDLRQSITLVRKGREYPLNFWTKVTPSWSALGKTAEWRHPAGQPMKPFALIVRLNISEDMENAARTTSYLVVNKITDQETCPVGKVAPEKDGSQNLKARAMADRSATMPCLKPGSQ